MSEFFDSESMWLNLTNAALGLVTLACLIMVTRAIVQELLAKAKKAVRVPVEHDDHAFNIQALGITMADGGEPIDEAHQVRAENKRTDIDPPNIIRSEN